MTSKLFTRWLPGFTLATWSGILLYFYFSQRLNDFLHPMFRPYVLAAGLVLGLMAVVILGFPADTSCCSAAECGHSLSRRTGGRILIFGILLLPISVAAMFSPDAFGKAMVENRLIDTDGSTLPQRPPVASLRAPDMPLPTKEGTPPEPDAPSSAIASDLAPEDYLERTPDGRIVAEVLDLLYAAQDSGLRTSFEGKPVQLVGQLMPDASSPEKKRFKAVRMFMTCCAADARPVATLVEISPLPDLPEMTWVKVEGISTFPVENGRKTAVIIATKVEKTEPPEEASFF